MALLRAVADLVFPPVCQVCRQPGEFPLCLSCQSQFCLITPPVCQKCGQPLRGPPELAVVCIPCRRRRLNFTMARAAGVYEGALREAIQALKFDRCQALAQPLGEMMAEVAAANVGLRAADLLVPVPLHGQRLRERGFNQAELLAQRVARRLQRPLARDILTRVTSTEAQSGLPAAKRRANVRGAFRACTRIDARAVLLIDDVLSTGSTASECARALRAAGAERVLVLTAALVARDSPQWSKGRAAERTPLAQR